jgi:hypothetical protein
LVVWGPSLQAPKNAPHLMFLAFVVPKLKFLNNSNMFYSATLKKKARRRVFPAAA